MTAEKYPKILVYSRDPGGTNVLIPMIRFLRDMYNIEVYAKDVAIVMYEKEGVSVHDINSEVLDICETQVTEFLERKKPNLVLTGTSTLDRSEYLFWVSCHTLGITCCANVDSWAFYKERFYNEPLRISEVSVDVNECFFPDYIFALDDEAKQEMIADGLPNKRIIVAGYWHFLHQQRRIQEKGMTGAIRYRQKVLGNNLNRKIILFLSEGFSELFGEDPKKGYGYHEKTTISALEEILKPYDRNKYVIIIRPHPKEKTEWWKEKMHSTSIDMILDDEIDLIDQMQAADLITGMQTQCLNDALLIGKRVISIQIGLNRRNPLFASRHNYIHTAFSLNDLREYVSAFFYDTLKECSFCPNMGDIEKFIDFIKGVIENV